MKLCHLKENGWIVKLSWWVKRARIRNTRYDMKIERELLEAKKESVGGEWGGQRRVIGGYDQTIL
jgi:hypothetical protein